MVAGVLWPNRFWLISFLFFTWFGCRTSPKPLPVLYLHSPMGILTIHLFQDRGEIGHALVDQLKTACSDSLSLTFIHQDLCIGLDAGCNDSLFSAVVNTDPTLGGKQYAHLRGALFLMKDGPKHRFYIVQGRPQTEAAITAIEQKSGKTYQADERKRYIKYGGAPQFDGLCIPFGVVVDGLEVIDKLAALPTGSNRAPLSKLVLTPSFDKQN
jgi:hypothetical protein